MKPILLAIALLFLGLAKLSAALLDEAALDRALKIGMDFQTGAIEQCSVLRFTNGEKWRVLIIYYDAAELKREDGASWRIRFNDFDDMSRIAKVYHVVDMFAPACIIFN
jgi:hypothetical protein